MNKNVEKLRNLTTDLERMHREHEETLRRESGIAKPLREATEAARRHYDAVNEEAPGKR